MIVIFLQLIITIVALVNYYIFFAGGVHSTIQFPHDTVQCLNQTVEYQCTVNGSVFFGLTWRVLHDNGTQLGEDITYINTNTEQDPSTIGGLFTVQQLSQTPLVSNISFTAVSSIDRYTIVCVDTVAVINEIVLINIPGKN